MDRNEREKLSSDLDSVLGLYEIKIKSLEEDNNLLRELLWLNHGCSFSDFYCDDGEMQCQSCIIDFRRYSIEVIKQRLKQRIEPK